MRTRDRLEGYESRLINNYDRQLWGRMNLHRLRDSGRKTIGFAGSLLDVTEQKWLEMRLNHKSMYDDLTKLPNRLLLVKKLHRAMKQCKRESDYKFAVVTFDLDNFKRINDSMGLLIGDELLVEVSDRVSACLRGSDVLAYNETQQISADDPDSVDSNICGNPTLARLGGDEFTILLEDIGSADIAMRVTQRIKEAICEPIMIQDKEMFMDASFGIAMSDPDCENPETFLRDADAALYRAKSDGRSRIELFDVELYKQVRRRLELENALRHAVERDELKLKYQPIVDVMTKRVVGFEALVRWDHSEEGELGPDEFIPIAEESGMIVSIGDWILKTACERMSKWKQMLPGQQDLFVNVNMATRQIESPMIADRVEQMLDEFHITADSLHLEITESSLLNVDDNTMTTLNRIDDLGINLCMDDFGTGYSALSYLHKLPIKTLKIDKSFIDTIEDGRKQSGIVQAIVTMSKEMEIDVIAEGVEEYGQLGHLQQMGCPHVQGFLFSRPMDADQADALVAAGAHM